MALDLDGLDGVQPVDGAEPVALPPRPRERVLTPPPIPDDAPRGVQAAAPHEIDEIALSEVRRLPDLPVPPLARRRAWTPLLAAGAVVAAMALAWSLRTPPPPATAPARPAAATPRVELPSPPMPRVTQLGAAIDAVLPARFDFNGLVPRGDGEAIAAIARRCGGEIVLTGHADALGAERANHEIALHRADAVRALLVERGLDAGRVRIESAGAAQPIASNASPRGRRDNRRVSLHCEPHNGGEP